MIVYTFAYWRSQIVVIELPDFKSVPPPIPIPAAQTKGRDGSKRQPLSGDRTENWIVKKMDIYVFFHSSAISKFKVGY